MAALVYIVTSGNFAHDYVAIVHIKFVYDAFDTL